MVYRPAHGSGRTTLGIALLLVVMRLVVRSERGAAIAVIALLGLGGSAGQGLIPVMLTLVMFSAFVLTATRFGLLTCVSAALVNWPTLAAGSATPEFARVSVWVVMAAMIAPGVLGFFTATRGRKQTAWLDA